MWNEITSLSPYVYTKNRCEPGGSLWCNGPSGSRGDRDSRPEEHALPVAAVASVPAVTRGRGLPHSPAMHQPATSQCSTPPLHYGIMAQSVSRHKLTCSNYNNSVTFVLHFGQHCSASSLGCQHGTARICCRTPCCWAPALSIGVPPDPSRSHGPARWALSNKPAARNSGCRTMGHRDGQTNGRTPDRS